MARGQTDKGGSTSETGGRDPTSRRSFFAKLRNAAALGAASGVLPVAAARPGLAAAAPAAGSLRVMASYQNRLQAAGEEAQIPVPQQVTNGDEQRYPNFIGNYSKGLPHNAIGEVNQAAYSTYLGALAQGTAAAIERVPLGGNPQIAGGVTKLVNPLAGLALDLEGTDSHQLKIPAFPALASAALADEAVELYWQALCRDVRFTDYATDPTVARAAAELSRLSAFGGPKLGGAVTPQTVFRGFTPDDLIGPYVSQFMLKPFNYGPYAMAGTMAMYQPGIDYMLDPQSWLAVQNGLGPFGVNQFEPTPRFTCTGRDLTVYVHSDPNAGLLISFYNAAIWLFEQNAPLNPGNPYTRYKKQTGFATFGVPHFIGLLGEAKQRACKAAWYAKWFVHRALRPEAYGGLVNMTLGPANAKYPLHADVLTSQAVALVHAANKKHQQSTYFLPQAFPEGSPQHPSYPQGHASMAGACATILKAAFDGSVQFNTLSNGQIVTGSADGLSLVPYDGSDANEITVNGEINKLASNIGMARNFAGIHWRSDYQWGLRLGEAAALSVLADQRSNYLGEAFSGFQITSFDGDVLTV